MTKLACIGDSITSGFTLLNPRRNSYPSLLQKMLGDGYEVRNFGVLDAAARFDADTPYVRKKAYTKSLDWNPDIVLIMLGSNDTKRRKKIALLEKNIAVLAKTDAAMTIAEEVYRVIQ